MSLDERTGLRTARAGFGRFGLAASQRKLSQPAWIRRAVVRLQRAFSHQSASNTVVYRWEIQFTATVTPQRKPGRGKTRGQVLGSVHLHQPGLPCAEAPSVGQGPRAHLLVSKHRAILKAPGLFIHPTIWERQAGWNEVCPTAEPEGFPVLSLGHPSEECTQS